VRDWLLLLAVVNPAAVAVALWPREPLRTMLPAGLVAAVVAAALAACSGPLLDALDVSPPTAQVATAILVGIMAAVRFVRGPTPVGDEGPADGARRIALPLLFPVLVTPQLALAAVAVGADAGGAVATFGAVLGAGLAVAAAVVAKRRELPWRVGARFVDAGAVVLALALAVDGVKTV
jgi:small neutral amino acid transporter SnatA (MarC family)